MLQRFVKLRRASIPTRTTAHCLSLRAQGRITTCRAGSRKFICYGMARALINKHFNNLRYHITCTLQDDRITNADIFADDFIFIMQGRVRDHHPAHIHRRQPRNRCQSTCPSDLNINGLQNCNSLFSREFMCNRPSRRTRHLPKASLILMAVNFIDNPVNIIWQASARLSNHLIMGNQLFCCIT